jgi:DNA invertase Pin-like site-specific DNA recombinase
MPKPSSRRAYSYIRFSHPKQAEGGSLERQLRLTDAYCRRKGLTLDTSLTLHDLGVSAFRGDNVKDGALGAFLEACRTGRVPKGSCLILENLDRLSRSQIRPALKLFLDLQDYGITIVTHEPEREYDPEASDALALIEPLIIFARAHEESVMKSHRRKDGWRQARDRARQGGGPMLKTCPAWLEVTDDSFRILEGPAAAVRQIYSWARSGLGVHRILERLVAEGVPPIGDKGRWVKAYVYRILTNPAAMGTNQPNRQEGKKVVPDGEPIPNYYPAVVSEQEWQDVQAALRARSGDYDEQGRFVKGGKASRAAGRKGAQEANLFTGLARCGRSGERMHLGYGLGRKGEGERKRYVYLCPTKETAVRDRGGIDYPTFEGAVLSALRELRPGDIADEGRPANGREAEVARLSGRLLDLDSRLERAQQRARTTEDFDAFLDLIGDLQKERKEVRDRLTELSREDAGPPSANLGEAQSLIGMLANAPADQRAELRRRLKARLPQLVAEVMVLVVPRGRDRLCAVQVWFHNKRQRSYLILHRPREVTGGNEFVLTETGTWLRAGGGGWMRTFVSAATAGDLDLRKRGDAKKLEVVLTNLDLLK